MREYTGDGKPSIPEDDPEFQEGLRRQAEDPEYWQMIRDSVSGHRG